MTIRTSREHTCLIHFPSASGNLDGADHVKRLRDAIIQPVFERDIAQKSRWAITYSSGDESRSLFSPTAFNERVQAADLVIADLTFGDLSVLTSCQQRRILGRPVVCMIRDGHAIPASFAGLPIIIFNYDVDGVARAHTALSAEIRRTLEEPPDRPSDLPRSSKGRLPQQTRAELAHRVSEVATSIADLRLNSLAEHVATLEQIAEELRAHPNPDNESLSKTKEAALKALKVLAGVIDILGTRRGARVLVSGAVAGLVGIGGWAPVVAFTITMAAWEGKDAFMAALQKLPETDPGAAKRPHKRKGTEDDDGG